MNIIFLHGWGGQASDWNEHSKRLERSFRQCQALKLPAFDLPPPSAPWGVEDFGEFVIQAIKSQGLGKVTLVGHSFGGRIAIYLASRHPDLIQSIILSDSAGIERVTIKKLLVRFISVAAQSAETLPLVRQALRPLREKWRNLFGSKNFNESQGVKREILKRVTSLNLEPELSKISCPCLIIWGERDSVTPLWMARTLERKINKSQFVKISGAGHKAFLTHSQEWLNASEVFLDRICDASS